MDSKHWDISEYCVPGMFFACTMICPGCLIRINKRGVKVLSLHNELRFPDVSFIVIVPSHPLHLKGLTVPEVILQPA